MKGKKNKGPQYANGRSTAPTSAPASSQRPTPRPREASAIMAGQRANRNAEMIARQEEILRRR